MKNSLPFKTEYYEWLIKEECLKENTAKSYCSFCLSAFDYIKPNNKQLKSITELVGLCIEKQKNNSFNILIDRIIHLYYREDFLKSINITKKLSRDWKSAIRKYKDFVISELLPLENEEVSDIPEEEETIALTTNEPQTNISIDEDVILFNKEELYNRFASRLNTQDRFYKNIHYPIRLIKQLFTRNGYKKNYDNLVTTLIENINICTQSNKFLLKDIEYLRIDKKNKQLSLIANSIERIVYTPIHESASIPFKIDRIEDVSLDHIVSMHKVMDDLIDQLPEIKKITKEIQKITNGSSLPSNLSEINKPIIHSPFSSKINIQQLEKELQLIFNNIELQLMDRNENTRKGKK